MKTYAVPYFPRTAMWETLPAVSLEQHLWSDVRSVCPTARLGWREDGLYLQMQVQEAAVRREYTGFADPVCEDSCLEFFFCPEADSQRYFNFEMNPNGAMYVGFGLPNGQRCRLYRTDWKELLQWESVEVPGGWGARLRIPADFIRIFVPEFTLQKGVTLRGNFYKCGDRTRSPHFVAWNPIDNPTPCFHMPQFFGTLQLK